MGTRLEQPSVQFQLLLSRGEAVQWMDKVGRVFECCAERGAALAFIDELVEGGGNFIFTRTEGGASLAPASERDADLASFQNLVRRVRANAGDGYAIHLEHVSSDRPGNLVDLLFLTLEDVV